MRRTQNIISILLTLTNTSAYLSPYGNNIKTFHNHITNNAYNNKFASSRLRMNSSDSNNHKDSDRAHIELHLEDMMGDDWRLFRAKLVAQEQLEQSESNNVQSNNDAFRFSTGAITSLFPQQETEQFPASNNDGMLHNYDGLGEDSSPKNYCVDPFATPEEIMAVCRKPKVNINKHRWAHSLSHVEPGCVLIANEKLGGVFHQTVVLVIDHHDASGSTGIIINRPYPDKLTKVSQEETSNIDPRLKLAFNKSPVAFGGPIMKEEYTVLHGYGEVDGSKKVAPGIFVGGSQELANEVHRNAFDPSEALFVKGHATWVQSQLSREAAKGVWHVASVSHDFILRYAGAPTEDDDNPNDLWSDILTCMGGNYADVAKEYANRGDMRVTP
eukprot:CAMPEP_0172518374 /NCGR_PEP_ID=MMETSP1066-20121228/290781_1 /TAXON_ID=671091 /ORGANISM="Coscinodiscus wailesii, Strain CCMP2513" /LENGTH=384 /DNA_ID=CAMNT_0013300751 /DNA_START=219 /DNA_END=1373 /DNA_ORIENTATION=-